MAGSIETWYYGLPYVTRFYLSVCVGSTVLSTLGLLNPQSLYLDFDLVWQRFQLWRLTTCFMYLGSFSFAFLMQLMILYVGCRLTEPIKGTHTYIYVCVCVLLC